MFKRFVPLLLLAVVGCSSKPTIVGDWTGSTSAGGVAQSADFKFNADKTMTIKTDLSGMKMTVGATYTVDEKTLAMKVTDAEIAGQKQPKDQIAKQAEQKLKIEWKSADEVVLTPETQNAMGGVMTLKRRK